MVHLRAALLATVLLLGLATASAHANPAIGDGYGASAAMDRDGTTHLVWGRHVSSEPEHVVYCQIPHGLEACAAGTTKTFNNPCTYDDGTTYGNYGNLDPPKVLISPFGDVIVMTHGSCGADPPGDEVAPDMNVIWQSTDNGDTFDDGMVFSRRSYSTWSNPRFMTWSSSVLDLEQRRIVSVISKWDNTSFSDAQSPSYRGGVFVQGAPLGITQTTTLGRLTDDADTRNRNGGGSHPSIVQRGPGDFVVAWVDPDKKVVLRQYVHPEDTSQTAINDASRWTALAGPSEVNADEPHLVTGPLGTFLMYRHTPNPDSPRETDWYIRRLEGSTLGQARKLPDIDLSVGEGNGYNSTYVNSERSGRANLVQDQANGRLHFVRALPGAPQRWNHVQYVTSDDGIGWSTNALLPKPAWAIRDLGAYGTTGNVGQSIDLDPWLGVATGAQGFGGIVGWSWQTSQSGSSYPFGGVVLPGTTPPTPVDPNPGDPNPGNPNPGTPNPGTPNPGSPNPGGGTPPPTPSPEDRRCRVLQMAALDVVADACFEADGTALVAKGGVHVNGMDLVGASIRFDPTKLKVTSTGPVSISVGKTKPVKLFSGTIDWTVPKGNIFALGTIDVGKVGSSVFGFKFVGDADVKLVRGAVEIAGNVGLPKLLGGVTAELILRSDNIASLHVRELKFGFSLAQLGPLDIADASLGFDPDGSKWSGSAKFAIPPGMQLAASIEFQDGVLTKLAGAFSPPAPGFPLDPFSVAYLTEIRAELAQNPLSLSGGLTIGAGPPLSSTGSDRMVRVDGDLRVTLPDAAPVTIRAEGLGSVMGIPLAKAYLQYVTDGHISAGGSVKAELGPVKAEAGVDGWFYDRAFSIEGHGEVCVGVCIDGEIVFSSKGFAGCAHAPLIDIGAGITWSNDLWAGLINPLVLISHIDPMPVGCDVGDYREPKVAGAARARAAQTAGERSVRFEGGLPAGIVGVIGRDGPPHVALVGPDGTRVEPAPNAPINTTKAFAFQSLEQRLTWFAVKAPAAGVWKVVPEADSTPITELRSANGLPAPKVTAKVTRGAGRKRVLTYKIAPIPGQTVAFAEQGKRGLGAAIDDVKAGTKGTLTFTPTAGPGGPRTIIAQVTQRGIPRKTLTVARYVAPAPPRPAKPRVKARRSGTKLVVSWPKDPESRRFTVSATLSDGRVLMLAPKAPKVTIGDVAKSTSATITVRGQDRNGIAGPRATVRVKAVKAKAKRKAKSRAATTSAWVA